MNLKTKFLTFSAALLALFAMPAAAQVALTPTTLSAAVTDTSSQVLTVASATNFVAGSLIFVDREQMLIRAVDGTRITVRRGAAGIVGTHASGALVYVGLPQYFSNTDRAGSCTSANELVLPVINVTNAKIFDCQNSVWGQVADYLHFVSADTCEYLPETLTTTNTRVRLGTAGVPVLNGVTNAAAGTLHLVCPIHVPTRGLATRGAILKDITVYVGSQTVAPTSIGTPTLGRITFATPATTALENTVTPTASIGGTVTKVTATAVTTVTTAGAFVPVKMTFSTVVDLSTDFGLLILDFPLVQSAASAMTVNTPGLFVHYRAPVQN